MENLQVNSVVKIKIPETRDQETNRFAIITSIDAEEGTIRLLDVDSMIESENIWFIS